MWNSETEHPDITWGHRCWKWKTESVVKRDKEKNIMCLQKKNVTFEWNRGKSVYTQRDADHRPAPKEEHLASDCGKTVLWLGWLTKKLIKNYTPFFFFSLHSSVNNLLVFKIYMQRRKRYPFWNNRPIKPMFFLQLYKFFLKHKFGVSFPSDAEKTFKNINKLIKIVTFVHFLYQFKTQCKIQWRDPEY